MNDNSLNNYPNIYQLVCVGINLKATIERLIDSDPKLMDTNLGKNLYKLINQWNEVFNQGKGN